MLELGLGGIERKNGLAQVVRANHRNRRGVEVLAKTPHPLGKALQRLGQIACGRQCDSQAGNQHQYQDDQVARQLVQAPATVCGSKQHPRLVGQLDHQGIATFRGVFRHVGRLERLDPGIRALEQCTQDRRALAELGIDQRRHTRLVMASQPSHGIGAVTCRNGEIGTLRHRRGIEDAGHRCNLLDHPALQQRWLRPHTQQQAEQPLEQQQEQHRCQRGQRNPSGNGDSGLRQGLANPGNQAHRFATVGVNR
ncbi:hypothetical protein D3C81_1502160 [compost metagenome]